MKNNKAFTLVELLAVLAVLAIVMVIATSSALGISNKSKEKITEESRANLKEAALTYVIGKITLSKCNKEVSNALNSGNESVFDGNNNCMKKITVKTLRETGDFEDNRKSCLDDEYVIVYRYSDGVSSEYKAYVNNNFCVH